MTGLLSLFKTFKDLKAAGPIFCLSSDSSYGNIKKKSPYGPKSHKTCHFLCIITLLFRVLFS